jgi:hypothetical protein
MNDKSSSGEKRPFAAKYAYKWQGWLLVFFSVAGVSGATQADTVPEAIASGSFAVVFLIVGIYLLRGRGVSPKALERQKARAEKLQNDIDSATALLASATGVAAVLAFRSLEKILKRVPDPQARLTQILSDIKFDRKLIVSQQLGVVPTPGMFSPPVEVFKDWIISGQIGFNIDQSTRGEVNLDGSIQVDSKGNKKDMRTATMQFVSTTWSHVFSIDPDSASDARRIVSQLGVIADSQKPSAVTLSDISKLIETILNNSGQPAAEKIKALSDLRFQRLLSDEEFEAAKAKVLGI